MSADGRLSRVLSGLAITGTDVRLALVEAGKGTIGALTDQLRLICYGFSASVGFYADRIRIALAAAGATTLIAVGPACSHSRERRRGAGMKSGLYPSPLRINFSSPRGRTRSTSRWSASR